YMTEWLYGDDGYYATYSAIGKEGDFYTSVSSSKFFGGTIAKHIIKLVDDGFLHVNSTICEIGAHHGYLMADIIEFIYTLRPELLKTFNFVIVERFDVLQEQQRKYLDECFGDAINITHCYTLSELHADNAFFYANEIFDAFPCELFYKGKIGTVDNHKIEFETSDDEVSKRAERYFKDRGEIAVGYEAFAQEMAGAAKTFEFMSFDYGEMQARPDFSIRIYKDHKTFPLFDEELNIEQSYANSDITYDVTFLHVKEAFEEAGIGFVELKAQMTALIDMGILELLEMLKANVEEKIYKQELEKVKMLIMPDLLGERFKMILFRSN
ncbi:MAG: SAM-dependent methyltransferase, partial [Campylobacterota bacterium]|nr:SAM-dependent methyltransferase [Campylobacterota bacterium]